MLLLILGALPILVAQPNAAASAGLSLGFSAPFEQVGVLLLLLATGLLSAFLPRNGLILIPLAFTLMIMVGGTLQLDLHQFTHLPFFILGAILCLCLLVGMAQQKVNLLMMLVIASLGFQLGGFYMAQLPPIAAPMYYLLGVLLSLSMILGIAVAFGVTLMGDHHAVWNRLKESPRFGFIRSIFL